MKNILVTASNIPDVDGVACAIAYANYLNQFDSKNKYFAKFEEDIHIEGKFVLENLGMKWDLLTDTDKFNEFILVDMSGTGGLPRVVDLKRVIEIIDHRIFPEYEAFPNAKFRIEQVGAAATQIAEFYYFNQHIKITPELAQLLLCAIYSNSINFTKTVANFRDFRMKTWLESFVEDKNFYDKMFDFKTQYALDNIKEVLYSDSKMEEYPSLGHVCLYQIEGKDISQFLKIKDEIYDNFKIAEPDAVDYVLLFQDIQNQKTTLLTPSDKFMEFIKMSGLPGKKNGDLWEIDEIMMRKHIIPYFRKVK